MAFYQLGMDGCRNLEAQTQIPFLQRDEVVDGYADYQGYAIKRSESGGWRSASFILVSGSLERFAYFGIESNLISYLTGPLGESIATAAANVNTWIGVASLVPVFGSFFADSFLARYQAIILASVIYILGLGLLTLSTVPTSLISVSTFQGRDIVAQILFFVSLYLVALGQVYKSCVQAFGADQFDGNHPDEKKAKSSFFNWWLCCLCIGATAAHLILHYIQDNINWGIGFGIPFIAMTIGLVLFQIGNRTYRFSARQNDADEILNESICQRFIKVLPAAEDSGEAITTKTNGAKIFLRLLPIWSTCLTYTIAMAQVSTLFTKQASTVDRSLGPSFSIPPASLRAFIALSISFCIPIYDQIFVPIARKITNFSTGITMLQRMGTGMAISVMNMVIAALIEMKRLKTAKDFGLVDIPNAAVPMSFWWLVPQFTLIGLTDVFILVGSQEFFYDQVPTELRSLGISLYFGAVGTGNFLSSFLISAIQKATSQNGRDGWFSDNLNRAHLDYFYWLLAGIGIFGFVLFAYLAKSYDYEENAPKENFQP
ncbi:protein NRT1/ PTR FAMILY 5.10-like [Coffea arabica]|uniref:Protein NRT1/ PTR FAMILY 5.10-like n=1 Tax=Coffea arabica TaxID=13443 RepID=A0A6P6UJ08_COFAR